ncbi:hypothetical protein EVAR_92257_1 [Eumeta japonica]|uniref:Uncharacterized protein n=1 Tax=Eumeta variegata TaxID=151549 RepID=A0A4C1TN94_EUMVA|nr:hypothetical protein EVAR_92257_1 [Eumeta japonica]
MSIFWLVLFVTSSLVHEDEAAKILAVFPLLGPVTGSLEMVTYVTPFPRKDPPPNLHQVVIEYPPEMDPVHYFTIEMIMNKEVDVKDLSWMFNLFYKIYEYFIKYETVQNLINDHKQTFDLAIIEWLFIELSAGWSSLKKNKPETLPCRVNSLLLKYQQR